MGICKYGLAGVRHDRIQGAHPNGAGESSGPRRSVLNGIFQMRGVVEGGCFTSAAPYAPSDERGRLGQFWTERPINMGQRKTPRACR